MGMEIKAVYQYLDSIAPFWLQLEHDNAGLLVGDLNGTVEKALLTLDVTPAVVAEAVRKGCKLVISHHPVIFRPIKTVLSNSVPYLLAANGITVICTHTNLDIAEEGVNDVLCDLLGISCTGIKQKLEDFRIGELREDMTAQTFAAAVAKALSATVRYNPVKRNIRRVAVCAGAGSRFKFEAYHAGVDALLTGEAKYHEYLEAEQDNFCLMAAGHFETENIVVPALAARLTKAFPGETFLVSEQENPVRTVV